MMTKRSILAMAMEEIETENTPVVADGEIESDLKTIEADETQTQADADSIEEAEEIQESVGELTEQVQASVDSGEGVSEETAKAVEVAVEHFCKRMNYKKQVMPAMEGFADAATRLEKSKLALENLKELNTRLDKGIAIAQEGFIENITTSVQMLFETEDKVIVKLKDASAKYDKGTPKTTPVHTKGWGQYLTGSNGSDVISNLNSIEKLSKDSNLITEVNEITKSLVKLTKEIKGNWFTSNAYDIERIEEIGAKVEERKEKILALVNSRKNEGSNTLAPLTTSEKDKLIKLADSIIKDDALSKVLKEFTKKDNIFRAWLVWQTNFRIKSAIGGMIPIPGAGILTTLFATEDTSKALKIANKANGVVGAIKDVVGARVKICSAVAAYIEASAE